MRFKELKTKQNLFENHDEVQHIDGPNVDDVLHEEEIVIKEAQSMPKCYNKLCVTVS